MKNDFIPLYKKKIVILSNILISIVDLFVWRKYVGRVRND